MRTRRLGATVVATLAAAVVLVTAVAEDAAPPAAGGRVGRLDAAGGSLAGDLEPVPEVPGGARDTFLWRSPRFAEPFEFSVAEVSGIAYPQPADRAAAGAGPRSSRCRRSSGGATRCGWCCSSTRSGAGWPPSCRTR